MENALPSAAVLALALLAACSPESDPATQMTSNSMPATAEPSRPASEAPALAVEGDGLRLFDHASGAVRDLAFGTPRDEVLGALNFRGPPETGRNEECGPGPLDLALWPDGLNLYFQDGKLSGWALDERSKGTITTASGIGIGSSRAELAEALTIEVAETSLGTEFSAGQLAGLLGGPGANARVAALWAGTTCIFR